MTLTFTNAASIENYGRGGGWLGPPGGGCLEGVFLYSYLYATNNEIFEENYLFHKD